MTTSESKADGELWRQVDIPNPVPITAAVYTQSKSSAARTPAASAATRVTSGKSGQHFQGVTQPRFMSDKIKRLRPVGALQRRNVPPARSRLGRRALLCSRTNQSDKSSRQPQSFFRRGMVLPPGFVRKDKSRAPPSPRETKVHVKSRLAIQPRDMRAGFGGFGIEVIAVEVYAFGVLAPVLREARWIQTRQQKNLRLVWPAVFLDQLQRRERSAGSSPWMPVET